MTEPVPKPTTPPVLGEIQTGDGLSLSAAGRLFPAHRGGGTVDPSTVARWVTKGMKTADGCVIALEAVRVGGRWLTSRAAVARFVEALTTAASPTTSTQPPPNRTPSARRRASEAAAAALKKLGA